MIAPLPALKFSDICWFGRLCRASSPWHLPWVTSDAFDVVAYSVGALAAAVWWNYASFAE